MAVECRRSLEEDPRPPFVQAAEVLRHAIIDGEFAPGEKLPSARALQSWFGIASSTVQNALRVLKDEGLVYSVMGRGSYVRDWMNAPILTPPAMTPSEPEKTPAVSAEDSRPPTSRRPTNCAGRSTAENWSRARSFPPPASSNRRSAS